MRYYEHFRKSYWSSNNDRKLNFWTGPRQKWTKWVFITWEIRTLKSPRPWPFLNWHDDMHFWTVHFLQVRPSILASPLTVYFGHKFWRFILAFKFVRPFQLPILACHFGRSFWPFITTSTFYRSLFLFTGILSDISWCIKNISKQ